MPRAYSQAASILEQLETARENIHTLTDKLKVVRGWPLDYCLCVHSPQLQSADAPSVKLRADEEERRVHELQTRLLDLRQRVCTQTV